MSNIINNPWKFYIYGGDFAMVKMISNTDISGGSKVSKLSYVYQILFSSSRLNLVEYNNNILDFYWYKRSGMHWSTSDTDIQDLVLTDTENSAETQT